MKRHGPEESFSEDLGMFAPPHNGHATSKAAADSIAKSAETMRASILEYVRLSGENGSTREELEIGLEMSGSTVRPRVLELMKAGKLYVVPEVTRATESGRQAEILRARS